MAPPSIHITKEQLIQLYLVQNLSTGAIAKNFSCNHATVLNYLKKYQIPRRSRLGMRRAVSIDKKTLFNLYVNEKLTQKQIAIKFGYSSYGIQRWIKIYGIPTRNYSQSHTKFLKHNFSGDLSEKAYIMGFRLGDLNVYKIHELIQVRCSTTKYAQIKLIESLFKKYGNVHIWEARRGTLEIVALLNQSFEFLLPKKDEIDKWIFDNDQYFLSFLAGYADAEGSYYLRKPYYKNAKSGWGAFEISTYDHNIINDLSTKLGILGIETNFSKSRASGTIDKRGIKTNEDVWRLAICKKQSLWNFIKMIETFHKHEDRLKALKKVKENLQLRNTLPYYKRIIF